MKLATKKIYRSKRHPDDVAQRVGEFIATAEIRTPEDLYEAARPKSSPIHGDFDWDSENAMKSYLRRQANEYMRFIYVEDSDDGKDKEVHAFYSIKRNGDGDEDAPKYFYYTHDEVCSDEGRKAKLSEVYYRKLLAYCKNAEDIGLDKSSESWNRLIRYIRMNAP